MSGRRFGMPRTEDERRERHLARYNTTELPPRGTGLMKSSSNTSLTLIVSGLGLILVGLARALSEKE